MTIRQQTALFVIAVAVAACHAAAAPAPTVEDAPVGPPPDVDDTIADLHARYTLDDDPATNGGRVGPDGTCATCPTSIADGARGRALTFHDTTEVDLPGALVDVAHYTFALWLRTPESAGIFIALAKPDTTTIFDIVSLGIADGRARLETCTTNTGTCGTSIVLAPALQPFVADATWHHVAASYDGARLALYVDGTLTGAVDDFTSTADSTEPLALGLDLDMGVAHTPWRGDLDDLRIFDRALTEPEIARLAGREP